MATERWKPAGAKINVDPTAVPADIDKTTFFSPNIPLVVRQCIPKLHSLSGSEASLKVEHVLKFLIEGDYTALVLDDSASSSNPSENEEEDGIILGGIYMILYYALASRKKASVLVKEFVSMNIPPPIGAVFAEAVNANRVRIEESITDRRVGLRRLNTLRWRIDVCISSGQLKSVMRPSILLQIFLEDGSISTFEITIEQFHSLRYGVAKLLHEMQSLERHPIMRITEWQLS